ncbi:nitrite reductase (NAD(P)H) small subunit [Brachybacterium muris]|uniref:nitrite reductase (NAD(P)H) small subunit n=1 Tax=Brachybacterium muris TaxID=219301 RepID=UPI00223ABB31|nr:nitrite reductase (NAD(P)H) small subunit [Brachybacterium muris]MCT2262736.1 nitrite reductase (NAD(P)H) small subunit [Brachybacterium muris]MCT2296869.1 nitrite reductase (NAD(P)H) small subunit [Brachybacterium muris]
MNTDATVDTSAGTAGEMIEICSVDALTVERGAAALLPDGTQIGVFLLEDGSVHAIQQHDPYSGTNILSRGLVGSHLVPGEGDEPGTIVPTIASPMYKQAWNLSTGEVLDSGGGEKKPISVFDAEIRDGKVYVSSSPRALADS